MRPTKIKTTAPTKLQYHKTKAELYSLSDILSGAPIPEEEVTPEDLAAFAEAENDYRQGNVFTADEIKREFGLL